MGDEAKIQVAIEATNNTASGIADAANDLKAGSDKISDALTGAIIKADVAMKAFGLLKDIIAASVDEAMKYEVAQARLSSALRATGQGGADAVTSMRAQAAALEELTGIDEMHIMGVQQVALNYGVSAESMDRAMRAAAALAEVTGQDLNGAFLSLARIQESGTIPKTMKAMDAFKGLTDEQLRSVDVVDLVNEKLGSQLGASMDTLTGSVTRLKDAWGDMTRGMADTILREPLVSGAIKSITEAMKKAGDPRGGLHDAFVSLTDDMADFVMGREKLKAMDLVPLVPETHEEKAISGDSTKTKEKQRKALEDESKLDADLAEAQRARDDKKDADDKRRNDALAREWLREDKDRLSTALSYAQEEMAAEQDAWKQSIKERADTQRAILQKMRSDLQTYGAPLRSFMTGIFSDAIKGTLDLKKAMLSLMQDIGQVIISKLVEIGIETLAQKLTQHLMTATTNVAAVTSHAAVAGAATAASTAAIPLVGPLAAVEAGLAMTASVEAAFAPIAAAAGGFDVPAGLNPLTRLHEKEMVLPASIADPLRAAISGGGGMGVTVNISAIDGPSVQRLVESQAFGAAIQERIRNGR